MKTVLVHDWLLARGGAERVLAAIWELFPSPIHTLFYKEEPRQIEPYSETEIHPSFLQKIPYATRYHRFLFPLFPKAVERMDLSDADVILSSSHSVAKGVRKRDDQLHICYCHTPMRYAWDLKKEYLEQLKGVEKKVASYLLERVRRWDERTSSRVDAFIANSHYVANRIRMNYQREARVIYPPVDIDRFRLLPHKKAGYYITHARLVPYKRISLMIEAFNAMPERRLLIVGSGPEEKKLKAMAKKNIDFFGYCKEEELPSLLAQGKAYLFAAEEDFGIGVVEAQAVGLPVIALQKGGACETVLDGITGLFFRETTKDALAAAIKSFEKKEDSFDPLKIRKWAERFGRARFQEEFLKAVQEMEKNFYENGCFSRRQRE